MERGYVSVTSEDVDALYGVAFGSGRMLKSAGDEQPDNGGGIDLSKYRDVIYGMLAGGGAGLAAHAITPKDRDEDLIKRMLSHVLAGAMFGGIGGYGVHKLHGMGKSAAVPLKTTAPSEAAFDTSGRPIAPDNGGDRASIAAQVADRLVPAAIGAAAGGTAGHIGVNRARAAAADALATASAKQLHLPPGSAVPGVTIMPGAATSLSILPGVRMEAADASAAQELVSDLSEFASKSKDPEWVKGFHKRMGVNVGIVPEEADRLAREYGKISNEAATARRRLNRWNGKLASIGIPLALALLGGYMGYTPYGNWQIAARRAAEAKKKNEAAEAAGVE